MKVTNEIKNYVISEVEKKYGPIINKKMAEVQKEWNEIKNFADERCSEMNVIIANKFKDRYYIPEECKEHPEDYFIKTECRSYYPARHRYYDYMDFERSRSAHKYEEVSLKSEKELNEIIDSQYETIRAILVQLQLGAKREELEEMLKNIKIPNSEYEF